VSTKTRPARRRVPPGASSQAPRLDTSSTRSMPGDRRPGTPGQSAVPVRASLSVSSAKAATGTFGSTSVVQSTRHHVCRRVRPTAARKTSAPFAAAGPFGYE